MHAPKVHMECLKANRGRTKTSVIHGEIRAGQSSPPSISRRSGAGKGRIIEGDNGFHTLIIGASPEAYNYPNWNETDLKDLADSINEFLKVIKTKDSSEE